MKYTTMYYYRKIHRYFGVVIGIQFLFWTLGGLFFAWSDMDQIHGDNNRKPISLISDLKDWQSPSDVFEELSKASKIDSVISVKTINFLNHPYYQLRYFEGSQKKFALVNAKTGGIKGFVNKNEAIDLAKEAFTPESAIEKVEYLEKGSLSKHHEYRGGPLPAYAISFSNDPETVVYISAEYGQLVTIRNSNWRIFDYLWMMHTMDYQTRDNISNLLLKVFSILGLVTIISGFIIYFKSMRRLSF
ncbi:hypothetical protein [Ancylomarina salipaludis]|uniref:hypothetical protein n=1 Tax=Ancylomarina salipaludis TaxID=2501299 RepID=UPI001F50E24E|nr:hypothetical protein [Ancylomarina salipaludis]